MGNVTVVVSDRKNLDTGTDALSADVIAYNNYYPGGMPQPNRNFDSQEYRYGFNGKEKDDELKGQGHHYDYGFRVYDSRGGRFLSQDPLFKSYPWYTPYQFAGNTPIQAIDLDGLEEYYYWDDMAKKVGKTTIEIVEINNALVTEAKIIDKLTSLEERGAPTRSTILPKTLPISKEEDEWENAC